MASTANDTALAPVPMLDFQREYADLRTEVLAAIEEVCSSQRFILGPQVERFEKAAATAKTPGDADRLHALSKILVSDGVGTAKAAGE